MERIAWLVAGDEYRPVLEERGTAHPDYFGQVRDVNSPASGPFRFTGEKQIRVKVWPKQPSKGDLQ